MDSNNDSPKTSIMIFDTPAFKKAIDERTKELGQRYKKMNKAQLLEVTANNAALIETLIGVTDHLAGTIQEHEHFFQITGQILDRVINECPVSANMLLALNEMNKHIHTSINNKTVLHE